MRRQMNALNKLVLLSLLLFSRLTSAQVASPLLDQDTVFRQVAAHRIKYPVKPASQAVYGRFYAGFRIDDNGHIQDIAVLYPKMSKRISKLYGFAYEIESGLKHMPALKPTLAGNYLLPIAFCFTHYGESANPIVPTNVLPTSLYPGDRLLLKEVKIYASSPSSGRQLQGFPASRQIGQ